VTSVKKGIKNVFMIETGEVHLRLTMLAGRMPWPSVTKVSFGCRTIGKRRGVDQS
jgi:hypothetical protein